MTEDTLDAAQTDGPAPTDGEGAAPAHDEGAAPADGPAPIDPTAPTDGEGAAPTDGPAPTDPTAPTDGAWHLRGILESLVFASDRPVKPARLARLARAALAEVKTELERLAQDYRERGVQLVEVGGGWQFRTHPANASFVREITASKPVRLSRAQMETLAIIAYRQPITRPELEDIRGVDSGSALKFLLEREVVKVLGRKEDVGRPLLYGTTPQFLEMFGLSSLRELPTLRELSELTDESKKLFEKRAGEPFVVESGPVAGTYESADDDEMDTIERPLDAP
ncbi:MAG: SMC-Scp complex subunit ScpB, partial [Deltaproteobacteria bacterium]|nr:SMC-Scp complex subunit ScpB [Deltaproteobacteria bacterium]